VVVESKKAVQSGEPEKICPFLSSYANLEPCYESACALYVNIDTRTGACALKIVALKMADMLGP
jgi:hypothetical protein